MSFALSVAEEITRELDEIVQEVFPGVGRRPMYGGIVFEKVAGKHDTMICGHFIYKNHVSIEFGNGYKLKDPDGILEGRGKFRRHIKLTSPNDIAEKNVQAMIERAFA